MRKTLPLGCGRDAQYCVVKQKKQWWHTILFGMGFADLSDEQKRELLEFLKTK